MLVMELHAIIACIATGMLHVLLEAVFLQEIHALIVIHALQILVMREQTAALLFIIMLRAVLRICA